MSNNKQPSQLKNIINKSREKSNKQSVYMVISDNSQQNSDDVEEVQLVVEENQQPQPIPVQQNQKQKGEQNVNQKPIRLRTFQQRLNLVPESKPSKRIKLGQDSQQQARIIRFGALKGQVDDAQPQQQDQQKLQKAKRKRATPWLSKQTREIQDACLRLHNETMQFYEYLKPSKKEHQTRLKIFNMVKDMIVQKYPEAKVQYFGSFATKLYLPDGDIDITVLLDDIQEYEQRKVYDTIHRAIRKNQGTAFCDIQYIRNSKVPLIKFVHIDTQLPFDVSVNKRDGLVQIEHVQRMKRIYPQFQPLVFVFKTMLKIRNMCETYTGGIGSFLLSCMILHFLRYVHNKQCYYTLGEYVMKFMQYYGLSGDWERKSVYVADSTQVSRARQPGTISFYSPQDDSHDIGRSAFKIRDVFNVFKNRFRVLSGKNFREGESILKELINPSFQQFRYYKYQKLMNKKAQ